MSGFTLWGAALGLAMVVAYVVYATCKKLKAELNGIVQIFLGSAGVVGATRLLGFVFTGDFKRALAAIDSASVWSLSQDDSSYLVIGALAIVWTSYQSIRQAYTDLKPA